MLNRLEMNCGCQERFGRGERIRTSDPHNPIVVRYQAALRPDEVTTSYKLLATRN